MIGRKAAVGMALLCALVFCAFSASSASAVKGTTAFTCVEKSGLNEGFEDAHCTKKIASNHTFEHVAIAENTVTKTHITNEKTNATTTEHTPLFLVAKEQPLVGETEIRCTRVLGHSNTTNKKAGDGEHFIHGEKITLHYRECDVIKPEFPKCKVVNRTILAEGITATSQKEGENLLFKPEAGTTFTTIFLEGFGCPKELIVEGEVTVKENGATIEYTEDEITKSEKLKVNKKPAALSGKATVRSAETTTEDPKNDVYKETGTPLSSTTVET